MVYTIENKTYNTEESELFAGLYVYNTELCRSLSCSIFFYKTKEGEYFKHTIPVIFNNIKENIIPISLQLVRHYLKNNNFIFSDIVIFNKNIYKNL